MFRWNFGWIFICQKFLISTSVYISFSHENCGFKSLRKVLFHDIFRTLSNSQFFKASCADTFRKLENSRNSTNFHKIVRKKSWELSFMKSFYQFFYQTVLCATAKQSCFQHFQSRKYSNNMCMSNILRLAWQTNSATHVWWQIKSAINIAIFKIATRKKLNSKRLISCNLVFI